MINIKIIQFIKQKSIIIFAILFIGVGNLLAEDKNKVVEVNDKKEVTTKSDSKLLPNDTINNNSKLINTDIANKNINVSNLPKITGDDLKEKDPSKDQSKDNKQSDGNIDLTKNLANLEQNIAIEDLKKDSKDEIRNIFKDKNIDSLLFSDIEIKNINKAVNAAKNGEKFVPEKDEKSKKIADKEKEKKEKEERIRE